MLCFLLLPASPVLLAKNATVSAQGIFSLNSGSGTSSPAFSRLLSAYEKEFLSVTGFPASNYPPVFVVLHRDGEDVEKLPMLRVDALEGGAPRIRLDLGEGQDQENSTRRLLATSMLLREYYADSSPEPGSRVPEFPAWVTRGMGRLCSPGSASISIPTAYLHGDASPTVESFLAQRAPDEEGQVLSGLYDAEAALLLKAGLKGSGSAAFRDWIVKHDALSQGKPSPSWPPGWQTRSVERRWLLLMAGNRSEDSGVAPLMSTAETVAKYDALLAHLPTSGHSIGGLRKEKGGDFMAQQLSGSIAALRLQANPIAVPLLDATSTFLSKFRKLPEKKITASEKDLTDLRAETLKQSKAIEGYLDWYEAAKLPSRSGLFDRLLEAPETRVKHGPVGRHLDAVEARGW